MTGAFQEEDATGVALYWKNLGRGEVGFLRGEAGRQVMSDGEERLDSNPRMDYYPRCATLAIERIDSRLPNVALRCSIAPLPLAGTGAPDYSKRRLNAARVLLLPGVDDPVREVVRYLNEYRIGEHRVCLDRDERYLTPVTRVALAGAYPGEIQWLYCGEGSWTEEEMLPLEELLHRRMQNWYKVYWKLKKVSDEMAALLPFRYYAELMTWQHGWVGGKTPLELAEKLEQGNYLH